MPQPDNQRERGAATAGSQRQVAPQGQMAANISPVSGGAAAAAPVLQIGQQAQIRDPGTALYEAIGGIARGVEVGLQNYEKMYNLVSETQYAEFETDYIKESERVKNDPIKMKTWLENNSYKPNRVTAKRYHTLHAEVNGKAYEEDQRDQWLRMQEKLSVMTNEQALEFLNNEIPKYDEDSPIYKEMQQSLFKVKGNVAASVRNAQMGIEQLRMRQQNLDIVSQMQDRFPELNTPAFQTMLIGSSLGLVTIDPAAGTITYNKTNQTFSPNAIDEAVVQQLQQEIGESVPAKGADYVAQAFKAADLPQSVYGPSRSRIGISDVEAITAIRQAVNGMEPEKGVRSFLASLPKDEKTKGRAEAYLSKAAESITTDSSLPPLERARRLEVLSRVIDWESGAGGIWSHLGIEDQDTFKTWSQDLNQTLQQRMSDLTISGVGGYFEQLSAESANATSRSELSLRAGNTIDMVMGELAKHDIDARIIAINPETGQYTKMTMAQYSGASIDFIYKSNMLPVGLEVVDHNLPGTANVPFAVQYDEQSGFVLAGTGSARGGNAIIQGWAEQLNDTYRRAVAAEMVQDPVMFDRMKPEDRSAGVLQLARRNPQSTLELLANPRFSGQQLVGSDKNSQEIVDILSATFPASVVATDANLGKIMALALSNNPSLLDHLINKYEPQNQPFARVAYTISGAIPEDVTGSERETRTLHLTSLYGSDTFNEWGQSVIRTQKLVDNILFQVSDGQVPDLAVLTDINEEEDTGRDVTLRRRLLSDYRNITGRELVDDILDPNKRGAITQYVDSWTKEAVSRTRIAQTNVITEGGLDDLFRTQSIHTVHDIGSNPNNTYSELGNMTAEDQAADTLIQFALSETKEDQEGVYKGFGFNNQQDYEDYKVWVTTGMAPQSKIERYTKIRRGFERGIELDFVPDNGNARVVDMKMDGQDYTYNEAQFTIRVNPEIAAQETWGSYIRGWAPWLMGPMGAAPRVYDFISGREPQLEAGVSDLLAERLMAGTEAGQISITRRYFREEPPKGYRNGLDINWDREKLKNKEFIRRTTEQTTGGTVGYFGQ